MLKLKTTIIVILATEFPKHYHRSQKYWFKRLKEAARCSLNRVDFVGFTTKDILRYCLNLSYLNILSLLQNVFSVVNLSRLIVPHFIARGHGSFAIVSSVAGKMGSPFAGTYTGSKHALQVGAFGLHELLGQLSPTIAEA